MGLFYPAYQTQAQAQNISHLLPPVQPLRRRRWRSGNPFVSPPPKPSINDSQLPTPSPEVHPTPPSPALKSFQRRTHYHRLIPSEPDSRSVVLGYSRLSYQLPSSPSSSSSATPRSASPPTSPSPRPPWPGLELGSPLSRSPIGRKFHWSIRCARPTPTTRPLPAPRCSPSLSYGRYPSEKKTRGEILGHPLNRQEMRELVRPICHPIARSISVIFASTSLFPAQIRNLCVTVVVSDPMSFREVRPDMLELVHSHWTRGQVCKVRCRGFLTVDMNNICVISRLSSIPHE